MQNLSKYLELCVYKRSSEKEKRQSYILAVPAFGKSIFNLIKNLLLFCLPRNYWPLHFQLQNLKCFFFVFENLVKNWTSKKWKKIRIMNSGLWKTLPIIIFIVKQVKIVFVNLKSYYSLFLKHVANFWKSTSPTNCFRSDAKWGKTQLIWEIWGSC